MSKEERPILEAKHVTKKFPLANGKELIANDDISLKFYKGDIRNCRRKRLRKVHIYADDGTA